MWVKNTKGKRTNDVLYLLGCRNVQAHFSFLHCLTSWNNYIYSHNTQKMGLRVKRMRADYFSLSTKDLCHSELPQNPKCTYSQTSPEIDARVTLISLSRVCVRLPHPETRSNVRHSYRSQLVINYWRKRTKVAILYKKVSFHSLSQ